MSSLEYIPEDTCEPNCDYIEVDADNRVKLLKYKVLTMIEHESQSVYWMGFIDGVIVCASIVCLGWISGRIKV